MRTRRLLSALVVIGASVFASSRGTPAQAPRFTTPWGHPDLQGIWNNQTPVPLERPKELGEKAFFTREEAAEFERTHIKRLVEFSDRFDPVYPCKGDTAACIESFALWMDDTRISPSLRTSLVVDPADGQIPYTPEGRTRWLSMPSMEREFLGVPSRADSPHDRSLLERCLAAGGLLEPNPVYSNHHYILQTPEYVIIISEEMHDHRIIPLDGRPHISSNIRQWLGDSRGRWEGETLVVESTNFNDRMRFHGATSQLRVVERFTRRDASTIMYRATVTDPATFTKPWTIENALHKSDAMIYESNCHEGNYSLRNILSAGRAEEKTRQGRADLPIGPD